jgi:hypothetical protein
MSRIWSAIAGISPFLSACSVPVASPSPTDIETAAPPVAAAEPSEEAERSLPPPLPEQEEERQTDRGGSGPKAPHCPPPCTRPVPE